MTLDNPVENWVNSDKKLYKLITKISSYGDDIHEQARNAFFEISSAYSVPKFPEEITEKDKQGFLKNGIHTPRSVFEEIGLIRYLEPNDDPRGIVLCAIYNIKNYLSLDINLAAIKHFGSEDKIPSSYVIFFTGENSNSELHFLESGKTWTESNSKYALKIIKTK